MKKLGASSPKTTTLAISALFVFLGGLAIGAVAKADPSAIPTLGTPADSTNPLERIAMIGASVTSGFMSYAPTGTTNWNLCRLNRYLDAAVIAPHEPVRNFSDALFFLHAEDAGRKQIDAANQMKPSLVVGLDFLFWFCYGDHLTEPERLERFDTGLKMLEAIPCPLIVGDIPDASAAANGMLSPAQVPAMRTMQEANRRLQTWAAKHPGVSVVKLWDFMQAVRADREVVIHGLTISKEDARQLLQPDHLHLQPSGCAVLTIAILDAFPGKIAAEVRWDPKQIERLATDSPK